LVAEGHLVGAITSRQDTGVAESDAGNAKVDETMNPNSEQAVTNENSRADGALKRIYQENKKGFVVIIDIVQAALRK
jgi:hypothetical protein